MWPFTERKDRTLAHPARVALAQLGSPHWGGTAAPALARDGYQGNAIAYRCVRLVADAAASVPLRTSAKTLANLLHQPIPGSDGTSFRLALHSHLQISGNAFVEAAGLREDGLPDALFVLRPDRMRAITSPSGWIEGWRYTAGRQTRRIPSEPTGGSAILHLKLFHPSDDIYGLPPLAPARRALDLHTGGSNWQKALLDNSARPSGALIYGREGSRLSDEQFDRLKAELEASHAGASNAGRPLLLEGGLDWKPMSLSPADMDFREARNMAAREIALAFGVPPMLLGLPGDNTYANYREANQAFWKMTVLPLAAYVATALSKWLAPRFGADVTIDCDTDQLPALALERAERLATLARVDFLTRSEKRTLAGFPADQEVSE